MIVFGRVPSIGQVDVFENYLYERNEEGWCHITVCQQFLIIQGIYSKIFTFKKLFENYVLRIVT